MHCTWADEVLTIRVGRIGAKKVKLPTKAFLSHSYCINVIRGPSPSSTVLLFMTAETIEQVNVFGFGLFSFDFRSLSFFPSFSLLIHLSTPEGPPKFVVRWFDWGHPSKWAFINSLVATQKTRSPTHHGVHPKAGGKRLAPLDTNVGIVNQKVNVVSEYYINSVEP